MLVLSFPMLIISLLLGLLVRPWSSLIRFESNPRILLVTAHPDDECMFFSPTILSIQEHLGPSALHSLCLSVGDADGLGDFRKKELERSLEVLGIGDDKHWVVDHPELRDNITMYWDAEVIASVVRPYVLEHAITTILTFDGQGISSHPNHISLPRGISHLISTFPSTAQTPAPRLFTLITVPLIHKYVGFVSSLLAKLDLYIAQLVPGPKSELPGIPVAVSGMSEYVAALRAMRQHESQLVWFRWLYVSFSRYMWVNEWVEVLPATRQVQR